MTDDLIAEARRWARTPYAFSPPIVPELFAALADALERTKKERGKYREVYEIEVQRRVQAALERDRLRAENERLRKAAGKVWIAHGDDHVPWCSRSPCECGIEDLRAALARDGKEPE